MRTRGSRVTPPVCAQALPGGNGRQKVYSSFPPNYHMRPLRPEPLGESMSEIEIHHEHGHDTDAFGKKIGVLVGIIGILLAGVTIASHREHTAAVIHKTEANDQWSFYQAKKIRTE